MVDPTADRVGTVIEVHDLAFVDLDTGLAAYCWVVAVDSHRPARNDPDTDHVVSNWAANTVVMADTVTCLADPACNHAYVAVAPDNYLELPYCCLAAVAVYLMEELMDC